MSTKTQQSEGVTFEGRVRITWLKVMYGANIVVGGVTGLGSLVGPDTTRAMMGIPPQDPVMYGIASGAVPLAFGIVGVLGIRAPLRMAPALLLQVLYKSLFIVAVVLPSAVVGTFPAYAVPLVVIFVFFIVGDLIAIPFQYVLSSPASVSSTAVDS